MQKRLKTVLLKYSIVLAVGVLYAVVISLFKFAIPCPIKLLTSFDCPACGVTRMTLSLLRFDFISAFNYNQFLFITAPIILFCLIYSEVNFIKTGEPTLGKLKFIPYLLIIGCLIFGILRNVV